MRQPLNSLHSNIAVSSGTLHKCISSQQMTFLPLKFGQKTSLILTKAHSVLTIIPYLHANVIQANIFLQTITAFSVFAGLHFWQLICHIISNKNTGRNVTCCRIAEEIMVKLKPNHLNSQVTK